MARQKDSTPTEFSRFIRNVGVRALDDLVQRRRLHAESLTEIESPEAPPSELRAGANLAMQNLTNYWWTMSPEEKKKFFDEIIDAAKAVGAGVPALVGSLRRKSRKKASARKAAAKAGTRPSRTKPKTSAKRSKPKASARKKAGAKKK